MKIVICCNHSFPHIGGSEKIIQQIEENARLRKNILLVAPNGTGKTVMALSALLPIAKDNDLKIIYMCRTHAQSTRVIKELQKIHSSVPNSSYNVCGLSIRGRGEMCLNNTLLRLRVSSSEAMNICKDLRSNKSCIHYRNVRKSMDEFKDSEFFMFNKPVDAEELIDYCRDERYCPYFLSKYLFSEMTVIVCNFQWVFNPDIHFRFLKLLGVELNKCLVVVDECHNIIDVATEVNSSKLIPGFLTSCISDLITSGAHEKFRRFVDVLHNHLVQKRRDLALGETEVDPSSFLRSLCKTLKLGSIKKFKEFLNELGDYNFVLRSVEEKENKISRDNLKYLIKFWNNWFEKRNSDKYFFCYNVKRTGNRKFISLDIVALDPREITVPIFRKSYACLNLTGTVNPRVFNSLTGLNDRKKGYKEIIAKSPFKSRNIKTLICEGINTKGNNRTPSMYRKMIDKFEEVISNTPFNLGIFCASYKILNDLMMNGLPATVRKYGKKLFVEAPRMPASKNALMLENFKSMSKPPNNGAVLLGVCGGRNSEGEDYPGDLMNAVVIAGFPYHLITPRVKAKINYYNKVFNNQGWVFGYFYPAIQRANQASGRPIRSENDKGAIIFMDSRFKDKINWISEWVRKEIKIVPDRKNAITRNLKTIW